MATYKTTSTDETPQAVPVQPTYPAAYNSAPAQPYGYPPQQGYPQQSYPPQQAPIYIAQQYPTGTAVYGSGPLPMHHGPERQHECGFFSLSQLVSNVCNSALLLVLQFFTMFFAVFAFVFVAIGFFLGVGLLPLCCLGLVVFGLFNFCLRPVASIDDLLYQQRRRIYDRLLAD
ncbi:hypothetical protein SPRG_07091 [Saprolegnia parasitica CBS 223.65]|uniref:Uncharacterized protein n=1 Tax=Saprolegnia parasitica (strain CBS 223.65) TaxID=695850 RepID=A0A067CL16_SAPPC|nr:hypothetical protein SPRG_07091 [Saprolegnia parasitica CBS 223.65]KDO27502.1 hypothetical protein SPRG_07091 [Saprolegnia parasitica CBS 223.65]|eukprot:XP_012201934.1 hypothetical protein SPRG_07091 [Saprolegnia parasitica CBS 223.65]